ncbi:MAG: metallophosphoesterase [Bacteroidota bacterium]
MRSTLGVIVFISLSLLMDYYIFQSVKLVSLNFSSKNKSIVHIVFWGISILNISFFLMLSLLQQDLLPKLFKSYIFATLVGFFIAKLVACLFFLVDDLRRIIQWLTTKAFTAKAGVEGASVDEGISRSVFFSWIGLSAGTTLFGSLLYGFGNKYNYRVVRKKLSFKNLPESFRGIKIAHISDIHSGSFTDKAAVELGVKKILDENPDIIMFTGDLVNNKASEMNDYKDIFSTLKAPMGVYSILGNHDYGDYVEWPSEGLTKEQNLINLKQVHADMGWRLLMNEHVVLEKESHQIALLGIENWGNKIKFPKYGKLDLAYKGADKFPFKILLSHDPSHWDAQVRTDYKDIDLMLCGHTHGMQFGLEIPGFKWSPVQYIYKQWAGLYEEDQQKLYVNRGFGFIGYPGRVGILPEITIIELV